MADLLRLLFKILLMLAAIVWCPFAWTAIRLWRGMAALRQPMQAMLEVWRSLFGWRALFRWDVIGAIVPGFFLAVGYANLSLDWFPHNLLIAQICFGIGGLLLLIKVVGHFIEVRGEVAARSVVAGLLSALILVIEIPLLVAIQRHKYSSEKTITITPPQVQQQPNLVPGYLRLVHVGIGHLQDNKPLPVTFYIENSGQTPIRSLLLSEGVQIQGLIRNGNNTDVLVHEQFKRDSEAGFIAHSQTRTLNAGDHFQETVNTRTLTHKEVQGLIHGTYRLYMMAVGRFSGQVEEFDECRWVNAPGPLNPNASVEHVCALRGAPGTSEVNLSSVGDTTERRTTQPSVKLIFKESSLFTPRRKAVITDEMSKFHNYLRGIGFDIPDDFPPIGVSKRTVYMVSMSPGTLYDASVMLPEADLDNRDAIASLYGQYIFQEMFDPSNRNFELPGGDVQSRSGWVYCTYYTSSFLGKHREGSASLKHWNNGLWEVRQTFGQDFADRLLFYAHQRWLQPTKNDTLDQFFLVRVMGGIDVMENNQNDYTKRIIEILQKNGLSEDVLPH